MNNNKNLVFNDGMVSVYKTKPRSSSFGAALNVSKKSDMEFVVKLAYKEMSKRDQDYEFADAKNRNLSIKLKTRLYAGGGINSSFKAVIGNILYSILKLDSDRSQGIMYFYLEEERELDG